MTLNLSVDASRLRFHAFLEDTCSNDEVVGEVEEEEEDEDEEQDTTEEEEAEEEEEKKEKSKKEK